MATSFYDEFLTHVELTDTDAFGVIFWGAPVRWAQRGHENLARAAGYPIERMLHKDYDHPIVKVTMEYRLPMSLGDRIRVRTEIIGVGNRSFHVRSRVFDRDEKLAVEVICIHVAASRSGASPELDDWVRKVGTSRLPPNANG